MADRSVGRPSKYSEAYCNEIIECLSEGHSVTAFAGRIGVARSTVFKWAEDHPEFSDALKAGQAKATAFWEKTLIKIATTGSGNATAAIFGVKNRAADDWRDKQDIEHTGKDGTRLMPEHDPRQVARAIVQILGKAAKQDDDNESNLSEI